MSQYFLKAGLKSQLIEAHGLPLTTNGGDSICLVKLLPYSEVDYTRFMDAEGVMRSKLSQAVRDSLHKSVEPWSTTSPMVVQRQAKKPKVDE